jgi:hypothetical protein
MAVVPGKTKAFVLWNATPLLRVTHSLSWFVATSTPPPITN